MDQQSRLVVSSGIVVVLLVGLVIILYWASVPGTISCPDGTRRRVHLRGFVVRYANHPLEIGRGAFGRPALEDKLTPTQYEALALAARQAEEIPRVVVSHYNRCLITLKDYLHLRERCRDLNDLARQINELAAMPTVDEPTRQRLQDLAEEYIELVAELKNSG
jgi:hypothetical protein